MNAGAHLTPERRKLLMLSDARRIGEVQDDNFYIEYPASSKIIRVIENMLDVPRRTQAPCLMVKGDGGTGKTSIVNQLMKTPSLASRLVFVAMNVNPYSLRFNELIADALGVPSAAGGYGRSRKDLLPKELAEVIKLRNIRGIVIDEFHDAMLVPRPEQLKNLSLIKGLSNQIYGLSVIGFGTKEARNALSFDAQLSRRFYKIDLADWSETESFRSFLAGIEENLPLKKSSNLDGPEITGYLIEKTAGRMDQVVNLLKAAACYAIRTGEEKITIDILNDAVARPWSY
ncbi:TniB family NTP-binding protein [Metapseudomonas resinovorans]|uniref:TniB family NTP-binding protein n=1 Tax=Metapseudomonas resinovorans TaxID=53412 RepID=UPI000685BBFE|nr:TniB family NTP-binding protein [Pseudomonas resinovorans]